MSRTKREGMKYFPLDVDFFSDKRIRRLISNFGADGAAYYLYILCQVYEKGYYLPYSQDFQEDAALDLQCARDKISAMTEYLADRALLDERLLREERVLSSHGIQAQYQESMKLLRRDVEVEPGRWILDELETLAFIKPRTEGEAPGEAADKSGENADKSCKNALKEKKENKNKLKGKEKQAPSPAGAVSMEALRRIYEQI